MVSEHSSPIDAGTGQGRQAFALGEVERSERAQIADRLWNRLWNELYHARGRSTTPLVDLSRRGGILPGVHCMRPSVKSHAGALKISAHRPRPRCCQPFRG